jgi:diaminopimelate decarboxylase
LKIRAEEGDLLIGDVRVSDLAARVGSPIAVYDADAMVERFYAFVEAFSQLRAMVSFEVDAIANVHVLHRLVKRGAGLSVRSGADLERAWLSGIPMTRVVYAGLGRSDDEVRAALDGLYSPMFQSGRLVEGRPPYYRGPIGSFSVETREELEQIARLANGVRIACQSAVAVDVSSSGAEPSGVSLDRADELLSEFGEEPRLRLRGLHLQAHRQASTVEGFADAVERLVGGIERLSARGRAITFVNLGGGMMSDEVEPGAPSPAEYAAAITPMLMPLVESGVKIIVEAGWSLCAGSCAMVSRVLGVRDGASGQWAICDAVPRAAAARSRAIRPLSISSDHPDAKPALTLMDGSPAGPEFPIEARIRAGDLVVWPAGGYGTRRTCQSACEVLLGGGKRRIILPRRGTADLLAPELESQDVLL